jgi:hypothetical protein
VTEHIQTVLDPAGRILVLIATWQLGRLAYMGCHVLVLFVGMHCAEDVCWVDA